MSLVLLVEDDPIILRGLSDNLHFENYDVITAPDGETGYRLATARKPDLAILDVLLPNMSGFELCRKLRADGFSRPILMLTARAEECDQVMGLDIGADDYVTKPFNLRELLARVRALLRRGRTAEALPDEVRFDDVIVDFRSYVALKGGLSHEMTPKEFGVLRLLAANPGRVVTRDELLNQVWGFENYPTTRTVDNHIAMLRSKLEENPAEPRRLITIHGVGYKLVL